MLSKNKRIRCSIALSLTDMSSQHGMGKGQLSPSLSALVALALFTTLSRNQIFSTLEWEAPLVKPL